MLMQDKVIHSFVQETNSKMWTKILSTQVLYLIRDNIISLKKKREILNFSKKINQLKNCENIRNCFLENL